MPDEFNEENLQDEKAELEALEEQAQKEREEKIFRTLQGCNILLVAVITILIVLILLYVNFILE